MELPNLIALLSAAEGGSAATLARATKLAADLRSPTHRQPINPKANYRTRDVALFEEAADALDAFCALLTALAAEDQQ